MWWKKLEENAVSLQSLQRHIHPSVEIAENATIVGPVMIGQGVKICSGAFIEGPVRIGAYSLIGNNTKLRGPIWIKRNGLVGFSAEIKNSVLGERVFVGPQSFIGDSVVEDNVYLGAMVRTSNHRFDRQSVKVIIDGETHDTGMEKLGAFIGAGAHLGIQVIILPGRMVAAGSIFGPRINIEKNLPKARYMLKQELRVEQIT